LQARDRVFQNPLAGRTNDFSRLSAFAIPLQRWRRSTALPAVVCSRCPFCYDGLAESVQLFLSKFSADPDLASHSAGLLVAMFGLSVSRVLFAGVELLASSCIHLTLQALTVVPVENCPVHEAILGKSPAR